MTFRDKIYSFLPFLLLIIGISSSIYLWRYFSYMNIKREREHLQSLADETVYVLRNRLKTYEDAHYAAGALFHAKGPIKREEWRKWVESTKLLQIYPGINGIGIAVEVDKRDSVTFLNEIRKEIPGFRLKGYRNENGANESFVIKYIEPIEKNEAALGFDMGSEPKRREAMEKSKSSGLTAITEKVRLVQDENKLPGFLMYVPIYESINVPDSVNREEKFVMWVYSPFITKNFIEGVINKELRNISTFFSFELYDGLKADPVQLLYSFNTGSTHKREPTVESTVDLYGNKWTLVLKPTKKLASLYITNQPLIILVIGVLLTLILSVLVYFLSHTRKRAVSMANDMTIELQDMNVKLERKVEDRTQKLQEINWFYENLIQSMHEGLLVLDRNFRIIKGNSRFFQLFKADRVIEGLELTELSNIEWTPVLQDVMDSFRSNEMFEKEYPFELPGSGIRYFSITSIPLKQRVMSDQKVLLVISDVTDKKENEQRRNDFIGFVTHELRTPLANLKAYAQLSERFFNQGKPAESAKLSKKLLQFIDRLNELVSELHDVTKVSSGKLQMIKDVIVYDDFITDTLEEASLTYPDFRFIRNGMSNVTVCADRYRLNQVLTNYISNAVKYSTDRKEIIINIHVDDGSVITSVKDFGSGIPAENVARVFERLYRVQKHAKTEGLGLGLYLSREIIKAHGGKVWVESEEHNGSEFFYCIPYDDKIQA